MWPSLEWDEPPTQGNYVKGPEMSVGVSSGTANANVSGHSTSVSSALGVLQSADVDTQLVDEELLRAGVLLAVPPNLIAVVCAKKGVKNDENTPTCPLPHPAYKKAAATVDDMAGQEAAAAALLSMQGERLMHPCPLMDCIYDAAMGFDSETDYAAEAKKDHEYDEEEEDQDENSDDSDMEEVEHLHNNDGGWLPVFCQHCVLNQAKN
ncbi:hypothetical protein B0H10DRAFT_1964370 [Mycena sp. CBHHK59/15]|nr:hypothetical protein B0H10DRAFT_1964370 [Mycena sp. CBHHK59/15]